MLVNVAETTPLYSAQYNVPDKQILTATPIPAQDKGVLRCGYAGDVPEEYQVVIIDSRPDSFCRASRAAKIVEIHALMQDKVVTRVEGSWQPLTASYITDRVGAHVIQGLFGQSLVNRFTSRRVWAGTSPLSLTLSLKFEADNDPVREVYIPVQELQRMVLPFSGNAFAGEYFLVPPGPNPFDLPWVRRYIPERYIPGGMKREGEIVDIKLGHFMEIKQVIVREIEVETPVRFTKGGNPLGAIVTIRFETFEIITKEGLEQSLYGVPKYEEASAGQPQLEGGEMETGTITRPGYEEFE